ncbi:malonyl-CoA decarboxylase [Methylopila sp. M107]|uniref:malonyl-CoA decarboxylase n=1 Tax=Methylopila sp. M107 TaxID=1101190 RepID=UPI00036EBD60|nr:malonyl-CoA decarboxylase [Methylopila sp. M107]
MSETSFFGDLLTTIAEQGRRLLGPAPRPSGKPTDLKADCEALLAGTGEASRVALANRIVHDWAAGDEPARAAFFRMLLTEFGPDEAKLDAAVATWRASPSQEAAQTVNAASEPRRQELIRRFALAPDGVAMMVKMREALLGLLADDKSLKVVDDDFAHLFGSWFNRGFLVLRPIDWTTPANVLEKIIRYEAVHEIHDWDELRRRVGPDDRRCFAFFHPRLVDEPLIFVEVALTKSMPATVAEVLDPGREAIAAKDAGAAVFYSISNCQEGLKGVSFGNFLIKQVVEDLRHELPEIATFVTLSPVPGFAAWLAREIENAESEALSLEDRAIFVELEDRAWMDDAEKVERLRPALTRACGWYLLNARNGRGAPVDPVARFHLGNGARLERVNFLADRSARAVRQAHGMMVNYLYDLGEIEANHEAFVGRGQVAASASVKRLAKRAKSAQDAKTRENEAAR